MSRARTPALNVRGEQPYVGIPIRVTLGEWGRANALFGEVFDWLVREGIAPAGAPFIRFRVLGDEDRAFDLEVGVPVAEPVAGDGRVVAGTVPGGAYATLIHQGHPDRLEEARAELRAWVREQGLALALEEGAEGEVWDGFFESFLTDPARESRPEKWSTEVAYLLDRGPAPGAQEERADDGVER